MEKPPKNWDDICLGDVCTFKGGSGFKEHLQGKAKGEHPFIKVSDLTNEGNEKFITNSYNWVSKADLSEMGATLMPPKSVVFAKVGAALRLNRRRILSIPTAIDNNMMAAIPDENRIDFEYLYFFLCEQDFGRFCQESAVPSVNQQHISEILINLPPLPEQRKIAAILRTWDEGAEKARLSLGLSKKIQKYISSQIFKSEKRPISDIEVSIIDGDRGKNYPSQNELFLEGDCLFLSAKNVTANGFQFNDNQFISSQKDQALGKGKLDRNDIVLTTRGTVGNFAFYDDDAPYNSIRINSGMALIRNKSDQLDTTFLYHALKSEAVTIQLKKLIFGSAQPQLTISLIGDILIPFPNLKEQKRIAAVCSQMESQIFLQEQLIASLHKQKRGLMQQLLSGQVRVKGEA